MDEVAFYGCIDYNGVTIFIRVTRRGSHIFGILGDQKIQVGRDLKVGRFLLH